MELIKSIYLLGNEVIESICVIVGIKIYIAFHIQSEVN